MTLYVNTALFTRQPLWNPAQAVNYAKGQVTKPSRNWTNDCDMFAGAMVWGFGGSGNTGAKQDYDLTPNNRKHHMDVKNAPLGAQVYWATGRWWHTALVVGAGGLVASTDVLRPGRVDLVNFDLISHKWNAKCMGWTIPDLRMAWGRNPSSPPSKTHIPGA
jgi:hypothetical protein